MALSNSPPPPDSFEALLDHAFEAIPEYDQSPIALDSDSPQPLANSSPSREHVPYGSPWEPGSIATAPWLGLSALCGALLCSLAAAFVLISSNGEPTTTWPSASRPIQPTVILAISDSRRKCATAVRFSAGGCNIVVAQAAFRS
jgi:hypothetical protein